MVPSVSSEVESSCKDEERKGEGIEDVAHSSSTGLHGGLSFTGGVLIVSCVDCAAVQLMEAR